MEVLRKGAVLALGLGTAAAIASLSVPLFGLSDWRFDVLDQLAFQVIWATALLCLGALTLRQRRMAALCVVVITVQGWRVWTPASGPRPLDHATHDLRLLFANVHTSNLNHHALLQVIDAENPDIIALLEIDSRWQQELAIALGPWPVQHIHPRHDNFGIAVYSRVPLDEIEIITLGGLPAVRGRLRVNGHPEFLVIHTMPPVTAAGHRQRGTQFEGLVDAIGGPGCLVAGDLNATPWSLPFRELLLKTGLRDSREGFGWQASWNARFPSLFRIPIDHILVGEDVIVTDRRLGPPIDSDHLPVIIDLAWPTMASTTPAKLPGSGASQHRR